jgi:hypothetical protein
MPIEMKSTLFEVGLSSLLRIGFGETRFLDPLSEILRSAKKV